MDLQFLHNLSLGFGVVFQLANLFYCLIGVFSLSNSPFYVLLMAIFGILIAAVILLVIVLAPTIRKKREEVFVED